MWERFIIYVIMCDFANAKWRQFCMWVENLADRHSIGTNGGYRVHQIPSQPNRGIFNFPTFFLIFGFLILTIWPISSKNTNNSLSLRNFKFLKMRPPVKLGYIYIYSEQASMRKKHILFFKWVLGLLYHWLLQFLHLTFL